MPLFVIWILRKVGWGCFPKYPVTIPLVTGQGRVLVMDDEAPLRKIVGRMLEELGYESEFAEDGAQAIKMFKEAKEAEKPFDAVILDLTVPGGMGGKEAINKLLELDPEVKAIVSSGYSDDPVLANFQEYGFKGMMPKPFEFHFFAHCGGRFAIAIAAF